MGVDVKNSKLVIITGSKTIHFDSIIRQIVFGWKYNKKRDWLIIVQT